MIEKMLPDDPYRFDTRPHVQTERWAVCPHLPGKLDRHLFQVMSGSTSSQSPNATGGGATAGLVEDRMTKRTKRSASEMTKVHLYFPGVVTDSSRQRLDTDLVLVRNRAERVAHIVVARHIVVGHSILGCVDDDDEGGATTTYATACVRSEYSAGASVLAATKRALIHNMQESDREVCTDTQHALVWQSSKATSHR